MAESISSLLYFTECSNDTSLSHKPSQVIAIRLGLCQIAFLHLLLLSRNKTGDTACWKRIREGRNKSVWHPLVAERNGWERLPVVGYRISSLSTTYQDLWELRWSSFTLPVTPFHYEVVSLLSLPIFFFKYVCICAHTRYVCTSRLQYVA